MTDWVQDELELGGQPLVLRRPRRPEDLIDEHEFAEDEFLPYWAELWPSGTALAEAVADGAASVRGRRVLEIGCGLGLPSLVAARAGARVVATDWSSAAVDLLRANADRNGIALDARVWRWDGDPAEVGAPFDLVLAADVLYERRNAPWLLDALPRLGPEVWLADPGRAFAEEFLSAASADWTSTPLPSAELTTLHLLRLRRG